MAMMLTDRYYFSEHFGILFAIFGIVVQKIWIFIVQIHFLSFSLFPGICRNVLLRWAGLARATDQWGNGHGGTPRRPRPTGRFDRSGEARTGARARGGRRHAVHQSVTGVHGGAREGSHFAQRREGSLVAAGRDLMVTRETPATSYGGGAVRPN